MENSKGRGLLPRIAIVGNVIFVLWIVRNGINEGFSGTMPEKVSYISLIILLVLNTALIYRQQRKT